MASKVLASLALALLIPALCPAQPSEVCTDFEGGTLQGWTPNMAWASATAPGASGSSSYCMRYGDLSGGPSVIFAPPAYLGDWVASYGLGSPDSCQAAVLAFDYRLVNDASTEIINLCSPLGVDSDPGFVGVRASFVFAQCVTDAGGSNPGWHHFEAPLWVVDSPSGPAPSNSYGHWAVLNGTGNEGADWNALMANVGAIHLGIELSASQSETYEIDNICLVPLPCNPIPVETRSWGSMKAMYR